MLRERMASTSTLKVGDLRRVTGRFRAVNVATYHHAPAFSPSYFRPGQRLWVTDLDSTWADVREEFRDGTYSTPYLVYRSDLEAATAPDGTVRVPDAVAEPSC